MQLWISTGPTTQQRRVRHLEPIDMLNCAVGHLLHELRLDHFRRGPPSFSKTVKPSRSIRSRPCLIGVLCNRSEAGRTTVHRSGSTTETEAALDSGYVDAWSVEATSASATSTRLRIPLVTSCTLSVTSFLPLAPPSDFNFCVPLDPRLAPHDLTEPHHCRALAKGCR